MKILSYLMALLCLCPQLEAQTPTKNYTRIRTMRNAAGSEYIDNVQYYDGLGRPQLQMQKNGAGMGSHLFTLQEYDACGRVWKNWLPGLSDDARLSGAVSDDVEHTTYAYNIRGWLTGITGDKFSQNLHYTDGPGAPCYNGSISSMNWKSAEEPSVRGYNSHELS